MKTFIFDLDGTIITGGQPLVAPLGEAINALRPEYQVIFASARPVRDMLPLLPEALHNCVMVGCNGGMAWHQGHCLLSHAFSDKAAADIVAFLHRQRIPYVLDGSWGYSVSATAHPFHDYMRTLSQEETKEQDIMQQGVSKILILDGNARAAVDEFLSEMGYGFNIHHHKSDNLFDITPQKENKYLSLVNLGVDFSQATVFGNDANDFAMLDHASRAVFVGASEDYPHADIYCATQDIPALLDKLCHASAVTVVKA